MAFPTTSLLDDFDRADNADLGTNWTTPVYTGTSNLRIVTNRAGYNIADAAERSEYWNVQTFGPDSEVWVTMQTKPTGNGNFCGLFVRIADAGGAADGYVLAFITDAAADIWRLYRLDNGAFTQIDTDTSEGADGDGIGLEAIGDQIKGYHRVAGVWSEIVSATSGTYSAAGHIGIDIQGNTAFFDNVGGGTAVLTLTKSFRGHRPRPYMFAPGMVR